MASIRRLVSDGKYDVLVLRDSRGVERLSGVESMKVSYLAEPPIDASWCPLKDGAVNASFVATCSVGPVMMFDADGDVRGSYLAMDANDKVVNAQSVCWRRGDATSIVGGYGAQEAPVLCGFDIHRSEVQWVLSSAKVPPPMGAGSGKPGLVTTVTEFGQSSMLCYGTTLGDMFVFDIRSLCVPMVFGRGTSLGRAHQKGVSSTLSIEESHQVLSIPRSGESNVFLWDTRNTAVPLDCADRGVYSRHQYGGPAVSATGSIIIPGSTGLKVLKIIGGRISSVDVSSEVLGGAVCVSGNGSEIHKDATVGPIASIQGGQQLLFTTGASSRPIPSGTRNVMPLTCVVAESDSEAVVPAMTKAAPANVVEFSDSDDEQVAYSSGAIWSLDISSL
jgi:hypothetical protein